MMAVSVFNPSTREVRRVSKIEAKELVEGGGWRYVSKSEGQRIISGQATAPAE